MICEFEKEIFSANIILQLDQVLIVRGCLSCFFYIVVVIRYIRPEVFCQKGVLRNFAKFIGKHLCQSLFLVAGSSLQLYLKRDSGTGVFL